MHILLHKPSELHGLVVVKDNILVAVCPYLIILKESCISNSNLSFSHLNWFRSMAHTRTYCTVNLGFAADDSGGCLVSSTSFMLHAELS